MRALGGLAVLTLVFGLTASARADVTDRDRKAAQTSFQEAQKAFKSGDYRHAAEKFEEAYRRAPHHAPLWNAGRAWQLSGELTRAANIYAKYLREAPPTAPDRNRAIVALKELQAKLGRIDVHAVAVAEITVDGEPVEGEGVYVVPGAHVVEGRTTSDAHEPVRVPQSVAAGQIVSVALVPAAAPAPTAPAATAPSPAAGAAGTPVGTDTPKPQSQPAPPRSSSGISPLFVVAGGVLTLVAGGASLASGLDVTAKKNDYLSAGQQTQSKYDAGKSAELRTNVLLGVTGGLALVTVFTAVVLVDWKGAPAKDSMSARLELGPGALAIAGTFR